MLLKFQLLKSGSITYYINHPLLELSILPGMLVEHAVLSTVGGGINDEKLRERADLVSAGEFSNPRAVHLDEGNLLISVPGGHVVQDLVEIIQAVVAVRTVFHVSVHENVLILQLSFHQGEVIVVILDGSGFAIFPPASWQVATCLH